MIAAWAQVGHAALRLCSDGACSLAHMGREKGVREGACDRWCRVDGEEGVTVEGPLAGAMRRAAYLYRQPTAQQQMSVGAQWLQQAAEQGAAFAQRTFATAAPAGPRRRR